MLLNRMWIYNELSLIKGGKSPTLYDSSYRRDPESSDSQRQRERWWPGWGRVAGSHYFVGTESRCHEMEEVWMDGGDGCIAV